MPSPRQGSPLRWRFRRRYVLSARPWGDKQRKKTPLNFPKAEQRGRNREEAVINTPDIKGEESEVKKKTGKTSEGGTAAAAPSPRCPPRSAVRMPAPAGAALPMPRKPSPHLPAGPLQGVEVTDGQGVA